MKELLNLKTIPGWRKGDRVSHDDPHDDVEDGEGGMIPCDCARCDRERESLPVCVQAMGCYCAGHARGNPVDAQCDTREEPRSEEGEEEEEIDYKYF